MRQFIFILLSVCAAALCGCDKQAKINSQKIDALTAHIAHQEETEARQLAVMQTQLAMIAPQLDKETSAYFERNHDAALFFHTNTLFLLITIGKQIESQLQAADKARAAETAQLYNYHTNALTTSLLAAAQVEEATAGQAAKTEASINAETRRLIGELNETLRQQIKLSTAPDPDETAWRKNVSALLAQMQHDLQTIQARLMALSPPAIPAPPTSPITNLPAVR